MKTNLNGTGVAVVTPFHNYGTIDFGSLEKVINHIIDGGVDFIVGLGTTGEPATMTEDEQKAVMDVIIDNVSNRIPIVMGVGGNSTRAVVGKLKKIEDRNIDAILSVAPYYNKPNQKGMYSHFKSIASSTDLPIILYNVPGRTASNISADTVLKLANDFDNIVAVKEASGDLLQVMEILRNKPDDFKLFSGDDALTFPLMALGADGVISVVANAFPKDFSDMVRLFKSGDVAAAREIHYKLLPIIHQLFVDGNPAGIKAAMEIMGLIKNNLRLPMVKVNKSVHLALEKLLAVYYNSDF